MIVREYTQQEIMAVVYELEETEGQAVNVQIIRQLLKKLEAAEKVVDKSIIAKLIRGIVMSEIHWKSYIMGFSAGAATMILLFTLLA